MWEYCLVDFQDGNIILQDSKDKITSQFGVLSIQRFPFTSKYDLWMKSWINCDWGTILLWSSFDQGFDCTWNSYGLANIIKQTKFGSREEIKSSFVA